MTNREDALSALSGTDWSGAQVDPEPRPASVAHSVRLPTPLSEELEAEGQRRGVPSALIRELVDTGLSPLRDDATVTVRVADPRRASDSVVQHAA